MCGKATLLPALNLAIKVPTFNSTSGHEKPLIFLFTCQHVVGRQAVTVEWPSRGMRGSGLLLLYGTAHVHLRPAAALLHHCRFHPCISNGASQARGRLLVEKLLKNKTKQKPLKNSSVLLAHSKMFGFFRGSTRMPHEPSHLGICISVSLSPSPSAWGGGGEESCLVLHHSEVILGLKRTHKSAPQMGVSIKGSSLFASLKFPFYLNSTDE